ncbi:MAG: hypothetical protein CUN57_01545 [Phototrophicales bacterium]|nr:MAG: hypothetical protein CUN57_01545 [Phototrophicales bacterium]
MERSRFEFSQKIVSMLDGQVLPFNRFHEVISHVVSIINKIKPGEWYADIDSFMYGGEHSILRVYVLPPNRLDPVLTVSMEVDYTSRGMLIHEMSFR